MLSDLDNLVLHAQLCGLDQAYLKMLRDSSITIRTGITSDPDSVPAHRNINLQNESPHEESTTI